MGADNITRTVVVLGYDTTALKQLLKRNGVYFPIGYTSLRLELDLSTGKGSVILTPKSQLEVLREAQTPTQRGEDDRQDVPEQAGE